MDIVHIVKMGIMMVFGIAVLIKSLIRHVRERYEQDAPIALAIIQEKGGATHEDEIDEKFWRRYEHGPSYRLLQKMEQNGLLQARALPLEGGGYTYMYSLTKKGKYVLAHPPFFAWTDLEVLRQRITMARGILAFSACMLAANLLDTKPMFVEIVLWPLFAAVSIYFVHIARMSAQLSCDETVTKLCEERGIVGLIFRRLPSQETAQKTKGA